MQLVQCWLTKNETAQLMGLIIGTGGSGNIGHEKNSTLLVNKQNMFLTSPVTQLYVTLTAEFIYATH